MKSVVADSVIESREISAIRSDLMTDALQGIAISDLLILPWRRGRICELLVRPKRKGWYVKSRKWLWMTAGCLFAALLLAVVAIQSAQAQTYTIPHDFTGAADGATPYTGVSIDAQGNLYGTTFAGGAGYGTVFKLTQKNSSWVAIPLYRFQGSGSDDGAGPAGRVIIGPNGSLYGTTESGGQGSCANYSPYAGCGTVFNLVPPVTACKSVLCPWTETILYRFAGGAQGYDPKGDLTFDQAGNIYGVAASYPGPGNVYELTAAGNIYNILYAFTGGSDGGLPEAGVIFDGSGNLYGTTWEGGTNSAGTVYQLTPSGSGWSEQVLHPFQSGVDGDKAWSGVIMDSSGIYGATSDAGPNGGGAAYKLFPSSGGWRPSVLYSFTGASTSGPYGNLAKYKAGTFYGTTQGNPGAGDYGTVFALIPSVPNWTYILLYRFTGGSDGANPYGTLVFDASGNLYGTTEAGGAHGYGVVFELTASPIVMLNPNLLTFEEGVGGKKSRTTTLTNSGGATLHITDITITGDYFSQTNNCPGSLDSGDYCAITVTFKPGRAGRFSGDVFITNDAPGSPQQVALSGLGQVCPGECEGDNCLGGCHCLSDRRCVPSEDQLTGNEISKGQQCGSEPAFPSLKHDLEWTRK
jgi:uncharacterized repeat protein (TIGR03803 family)